MNRDKPRTGSAVHAAKSPSETPPQGYKAGQPCVPLHVLIVEDEMLPAMLLETAVIDAGHAARKAARLPKAMDLANAEHFDPRCWT